MKFLCDVHLPISLVDFFFHNKIDSIQVSIILQKSHTKDQDICRYADEHDLVVITKDKDFQNSHFLQRTPRKLIKISLGNISNKLLFEIFKNNLSSILHVDDKPYFYIEIGKETINILLKE